jgi:thiamine-monophosphate kinase
MPTQSEKPGEFDVIEACFRPLTKNIPGAFSLTDDAAVFTPPKNKQIVVTKDAMVAGVHFLETDTPENIARKLLRTNLSDIAAMGGVSFGYLLSTAWTNDTDITWIRKFAAGLAADQEEYGVSLLGGDTVRTDGPLTFSLTLMGTLPNGQVLRRNAAKPGDLICVSGTIGDGALGLLVALGELTLSTDQHNEDLNDRYRLPRPRVSLGPNLLGLANACLDVSDGLLADLSHICTQSNVGACVYQHKIPVSSAAQEAVQMDARLWEKIVSGGDDYELLFTVPATQKNLLVKLAERLEMKLTVIGEIIENLHLDYLDQNNNKIIIKTKGWSHF